MDLLQDLYRLRDHEKKTREEILSRQQVLLNRLLQYVREHSPYYKKIFEENGITEDPDGNFELTRLPVMEKETFMAHFDEILTVRDVTQAMLRRFDEQSPQKEQELPGGYHVVHSSGSTGQPQYFLYDRPAWERMLAGIVRGALWGMSGLQIAGLLAGGIRILYIAAAEGRYGGVLSIGDGVRGLGGEYRALDIGRPLSDWQQVITEYRPNVLIGYPSALKIFAGLLRDGAVSCRLKRVISCGEPLSPVLRAELEARLSLPVINFYGAGESLAMGVEVRPEEGMILFDDMNLIECRDGEILLTCLYNYAQPVIRYRLHDSLSLIEPDTYPAFTRARGRVFREEDLLWFPNEAGHPEFIHPLAVEGFQLEGLKDYQFLQTGPDSLHMLAEVPVAAQRQQIGRILQERMEGILREKHLRNIHFAIRFTDRILPDPKTGKKKLVLTEEKRGFCL